MSGISRASTHPHRGANLVLIAALLLTTAGATLFARPGHALAQTATTTTALNLRAKASTSSAVKLVMPAGASVEVIRRLSNGFYRVVYRGVGGYAHGDYLSIGGGGGGYTGGGGYVSNDGPTGTAVTTTALNLRAGPSTADRVLRVMPGGATVTLTGSSSGGFLSVKYDGTSGWASGDYLSIGGGGGNGGGGGGSGYDWNGDGVWQRDEIIGIIYAAADYYGQSRSAMLRVAQCESNLDPYNVTPPYNASGLFQFLPGTWATTPYASANIFDPVSNAFAAGWMWAVGRRGEWVCQ